jgi:hypothetical protein
LHPFYQSFLKGYKLAKFCHGFRLRSYDPGNTQPRPILEVKQGSALISSMVGDHIRTERDVIHSFAFFFPPGKKKVSSFFFTSLLYFKTSLLHIQARLAALHLLSGSILSTVVTLFIVDIRARGVFAKKKRHFLFCWRCRRHTQVVCTLAVKCIALHPSVKQTNTGTLPTPTTFVRPLHLDPLTSVASAHEYCHEYITFIHLILVWIHHSQGCIQRLADQHYTRCCGCWRRYSYSAHARAVATFKLTCGPCIGI